MEMKGIYFLLSIFCLVLFTNAQNTTTTCIVDAYPPDSKTKVGWYTIDLDLPPEKRWLQLGKEKAPEIKKLVAAFENYLSEWTSAAKYAIDFVDSVGGTLDGTLPYPFAGEMKGWADATGLHLGEVLLFNLFYEFFTVCTSIVAEDPNHDLYHGRNLDFGLFLGWNSTEDQWVTTDRLKPLIVNLDWKRNNKTLFKSVNFAGYSGILTAIKPQIFTMSMDERFNINGGFIGILKWLLGDHKQRWMGFLTRDVMENATSYSEAVSKLNNTVMMAPAYFIVGGNKSGEGAVITRARQNSLDLWRMKAANEWYILETNYDHWQAPLIVDDRRGPAHQCMDKMGQKGTGLAGVFNVLSSQPVLNKLTTYTALMHVATGHLETYIRTCKDPCAPW